MNDKLIELGAEVNDRVKYINHGGCGVYAALLGESIQRITGQYPKYIVFKRDACVDALMEDIKNNNPIGWTHVLVVVGVDQYADSDGIHTLEDIEDEYLLDVGVFIDNVNSEIDESCDWCDCAFIVDHDYVLTCLTDLDEWNHWFNRSQGVPSIIECINEYLDVQLEEDALSDYLFP